ncbi:MAG: hypothetical protein GY841_13910, partial [FCB group bacterium]|nr:hypothetical protein [FCB group bacterium]
MKEGESGRKVARAILNYNDWSKLSSAIVSTAITTLQKEESGKEAAKTILQQKDFWKLPNDIVSTVMKTLQEEKSGREAAKTILAKGLEVHTFILFNAIKALSRSDDETDHELVTTFIEG